MNSIKGEGLELKKKKAPRNILKISLSMAVMLFVINMDPDLDPYTSFFEFVKPAEAAPLTSVSVVPASGLKNQRTTYDIFLTTATTGTIKTVDMTFPSSFDLTQATKLIEREGIGSGSLSSSGSTLKYTVNNPVSVSAGTTIRLEIARIIAANAGSFTVNIKTTHPVGSTIDGSTTSGSFVIRSVFGQDVSTSFMKSKTLLDDTAGHARGWDPDGTKNSFTIDDPDVNLQSRIIVNLNSGLAVCNIGQIAQGGFFTVDCANNPANDNQLHYVIVNLPNQVITSPLSSTSSESSSSTSSSQYESLRAHDQIASEFP